MIIPNYSNNIQLLANLLILSDVNLEMPDAYLAIFPGTKFFLMTCGEDVSDVLDGLDMVTIVKKPFTFKSMISLLERSVRM